METVLLFGSKDLLRNQVYIAGEIGLLDKATTADLVAELKQISAMLQSIANTLNRLKAVVK